ncbi:MAG: hypothetical protein O2955_22170 [Planctomycetota bacterium]|nr:hypothetical protein [Planctomycetota bacterium]MDA1215214.1 hypothetical protein [Planctomycetota bacterium]
MRSTTLSAVSVADNRVLGHYFRGESATEIGPEPVRHAGVTERRLASA